MHCRLSAWVSLFGSISDLNFYFFPAASEQFILISLDHLHYIYGQLKESRCGGGHEYLGAVKWLNMAVICRLFVQGGLDVCLLELGCYLLFYRPAILGFREMDCFQCILHFWLEHSVHRDSTCLCFWLKTILSGWSNYTRTIGLLWYLSTVFDPMGQKYIYLN
jgi:hypothetical protein